MYDVAVLIVLNIGRLDTTVMWSRSLKHHCEQCHISSKWLGVLDHCDAAFQFPTHPCERLVEWVVYMLTRKIWQIALRAEDFSDPNAILSVLPEDYVGDEKGSSASSLYHLVIDTCLNALIPPLDKFPVCSLSTLAAFLSTVASVTDRRTSFARRLLETAFYRHAKSFDQFNPSPMFVYFECLSAEEQTDVKKAVVSQVVNGRRATKLCYEYTKVSMAFISRSNLFRCSLPRASQDLHAGFRAISLRVLIWTSSLQVSAFGNNRENRFLLSNVSTAFLLPNYLRRLSKMQSMLTISFVRS